MNEPGPDNKTYLAFASTVLIGGANFIAVSFSNHEMPPLFGAALRFALGTALFGLIAWGRHIPLARGRSLAGAALYGLLGFGAAYAFLYYALVGLAAGTAAVIVAAVPLFTLIIAVLLGQERLTLRAVAGAILAIAGIAILSLDSLGGELGRPYLIAAILGTVAAAASSVVAKALPEVHPVNMNVIGMAFGTILLVASSLMMGEPWALPRETPTLLALGWLVILGSVALFQLWLYVIKRWSASATTYSLAGMPLVAVVLGALLLEQPITVGVLAGGTLVITAVYVGAIAGTRRAKKKIVQPETP